MYGRGELIKKSSAAFDVLDPLVEDLFGGGLDWAIDDAVNGGIYRVNVIGIGLCCLILGLKRDLNVNLYFKEDPAKAK